MKLLGYLLAAAISIMSNLGVVFENPRHHNVVGGPPGYYDEFGRHEVADDFTLTSAAEIRRIQWIGGTPFGIAPDLFSIRIYADQSGLPGTPLFSMNAGAGNPVSTGISGSSSYSVVLETPFQAQSNQRYWISVVNQTSPNWEWQFSSEGLVRRRYPDISQAWTDAYGNNVAFSLLVVPEPGPISLLCTGALALLLIHRSATKRNVSSLGNSKNSEKGSIGVKA